MTYAFTIAAVNAMTLGGSEIFIPDFGRFELKQTEPRDENEDEERGGGVLSAR
jgi:hypothetical protein